MEDISASNKDIWTSGVFDDDVMGRGRNEIGFNFVSSHFIVVVFTIVVFIVFIVVVFVFVFIVFIVFFIVFILIDSWWVIIRKAQLEEGEDEIGCNFVSGHFGQS